MYNLKRIILIIIMFGVTLSAQCAEPQQLQPLSGQDVERMLKSYSDIVKKFDGFNATLAEDMGDFVAAQNTFETVKKIVQQHGYRDFVDWQSYLTRIAMAYSAYQNSTALEASEQEKQIKAIQENTHLSSEQKANMIAMLENMNDIMQNTLSASKADIAAVKPYAERLEKLFNAD